MAAYLVVEIEVTDPDRYEEYRRQVPPLLERFGGRYLVRGGKAETLEGSRVPRRIVIVEFESYERARAWWSSPEYADLKKLRQATTITDMMLVDGVPPGFRP